MKTTRVKKRYYLISIITILVVSALCFSVRDEMNYRVTALVLLLTVSVIAMLYDIIPVLISAMLSAFIWNYCFIPPLFTLDISNAEDLLLFLSYFFVALLNAVLTYKIRQAEKRARDKEEKENTIKLYNTLLNSLSHELRTPISTIIGVVDTLKESDNHLSKELHIDLLNEIDIATMRLNRQVENILNMSRLESGTLKPKLDWCDINELVNGAIQKVNSGNHRFVYEENEAFPFFKIDIGFTEQILMNLLHNAVHYTPEGSLIQMTAEHDSGHLKLTVADNGAGISSTELIGIFEKFYRLPNSRAGGSGLGLSIVKGFADAQGGTAFASNRTEGGTIFTVIIPGETTYLNSLKNE